MTNIETIKIRSEPIPQARSGVVIRRYTSVHCAAYDRISRTRLVRHRNSEHKTLAECILTNGIIRWWGEQWIVTSAPHFVTYDDDEGLHAGTQFLGILTVPFRLAVDCLYSTVEDYEQCERYFLADVRVPTHLVELDELPLLFGNIPKIEGKVQRIALVDCTK